MAHLTENKDYYATHIQRDVLVSKGDINEHLKITMTCTKAKTSRDERYFGF